VDAPRSSSGRESGRALRLCVIALTVAPVLMALGGAVFVALGADASREMACRILPNRLVFIAPGDDRCPLELHAQVRKAQLPSGETLLVTDTSKLREAVRRSDSILRLSVSRQGKETWFDVPIREATPKHLAARIAAAAVAALCLMWIPLSLLWRSSSGAAFPLAFFYAATSVLAITFSCGRGSDWMARASLLAMAAAPAPLAHLSFLLPRERRVVREAPELMWLPYLVAGILVPIGWFCLERNPVLWPTFTYLLVALMSTAWFILICSCAFALRESRYAVERARARVILVGSLCIPILPTLLLVREAAGPQEVAATHFWGSAVAMPLPIGLAISRYNLFDLGLDTRHWIGRIVYFGTAALVITVALLASFSLLTFTAPVGDPLLLYILSFGCVVIIEPLRTRMLGLLDSLLSPSRARLRRLHERLAHEVSHGSDPDSIARALGRSIQLGLEPRAGCVVLSSGEQWRVAHAFGRGFLGGGSLAQQGRDALGDKALVHLSQLSGDVSSSQLPLLDAGVAVVGALEGGGRCYGVVLLRESASSSPYNGADLGFVAATAARAGAALHDLRLTSELICAERHVTTSRIALGLAHDIGKELDWLLRLARRLPERVDDRSRLLRDVSMIQDFTEGLVQQVHDFVRDATDSASDPPGVVRLGEIIDTAVERMARIHGEGRISHNVDPSIRSVRCHENIGRAVTNLLDNALLASDREEAVHVFATESDGGMRITVTDRGCGVAESMVPEAFKPGFTTRASKGGLGVGLPVSREIVESLGGTLELDPNPGGGMCATICIPAPCQERPC